MPLFNATKDYIENKLLDKKCEYREIIKDVEFGSYGSEPLCESDVSILLIGGDLVYNFMTKKLCTSSKFYVYNTSPRSFSNPLVYKNNELENSYDGAYVVGSYFPFVDNKRSNTLKDEIEKIIDNKEDVLYEDFVSLYIYINIYYYYYYYLDMNY